MRLFEDAKKSNGDVVFEDVVEILKNAGSNEATAKKLISEMNNEPDFSTSMDRYLWARKLSLIKCVLPKTLRE